MECKCGCEQLVASRRVFVNKAHQLEWMLAGGAREIGALEPPEARARGGMVAGRMTADSGKLAAAGKLGGQRAREIAVELRRKRAEQAP
jgi:hypothetical protein